MKSAADRAAGSARWLLLAVGLSFVATYLVVALLRLGHPFELEWMEGGMVDHVRRILGGKKIYAEPSLDFVSFLYPPLYYYLSAALSALMGLGFLPLRLISFASSLACFYAIFAFVRRECGVLGPALLSAALYAATFEKSGGWFDIARADSLFLAILLAALFPLRFRETPRGFAAAGLLFALAFLVKQSALVIAVPIMVYAVFTHGRLAAAFVVPALLAMGASVLVLNRIHDGWFTYYCFTLPRHHPIVREQIRQFWSEDLLRALPAACAASLAYPVARWRSGDRRTAGFYVALAAGTIGASWSVRSLAGAHLNNLVPAYATLSILSGLAFHEIVRRCGRISGRTPKIIEIAACGAFALQFLLLAYDPRAHLPTGADRASGWRVVETIRRIEGEVYVPHHGYLARLAGKPGYAHTLAMDNVFLDDQGPVAKKLWREMRRALERRRFSAVLMESDLRYGRLISEQYRLRSRLFESPHVFFPVAGARLRPEYLFVPRAGS